MVEDKIINLRKLQIVKYYSKIQENNFLSDKKLIAAKTLTQSMALHLAFPINLPNLNQ